LQHITCLKHGHRTEIWSISSVFHYVTLLCWMLSYWTPRLRDFP
jgi:hypothetical protein